MTDPTTPLRFPERLTAARRLAVGFPVASVARAANRTVELIDDLTRDPDFLQLVASWHDLFSLSAEARTRRLMKLAHAALEAALTSGLGIATSTALALMELERRKVDPVVHLAEGLSRIAGREIRRLQKAAAAPAADAAQPSDPRKRPARPADSFARRVDAVAARLRGEIVAEHGWTSEPLGRHDLNLSPVSPAAEAAPAASPAAADTATAAPTNDHEAAAPTVDDAAAIAPGEAAAEQKLANMMRGELAGLSVAKLAVLARFSPDDWSRFFLQLMRPPGQEPPPDAVQPGKARRVVGAAGA